MMLFITRIPTHLNDGSPVSDTEMDAVLEQVWKEFGGFTLEGPDRGAWLGDDGKLYEETSYRLEVACDRDDYSRARGLVIAIGKALQQEAMYFETRYADGVEIIGL